MRRHFANAVSSEFFPERSRSIRVKNQLPKTATIMQNRRPLRTGRKVFAQISATSVTGRLIGITEKNASECVRCGRMVVAAVSRWNLGFGSRATVLAILPRFSSAPPDGRYTADYVG